jgi:ubiquinone/menaquinone biosynthesis C-methylase UbiE
MSNRPIYNTIGHGYNNTRTADSYIAGRLFALLAPKPDGKYLDIGCGTGNYLHALTEMGVNFIGIDPSETMLDKAREFNPGTTFICAKAEDLPIEDNHFDGGIGTFTLHHWDDMQRGINEVYRVLRPGASFVFFSFTPDQLYGYWLCHYFPEMMRVSAEVVLEEDAMRDIFLKAGFMNIDTEKYFIHDGLTDHFLYSNKYKPEQYLIPEVRNGASSFRIYAEPEEVEQGLQQLEIDIRSGGIMSVIQRYENTLGDYLFYRVQKPFS